MNFKEYIKITDIKITEQNTVGTHNDFATGAMVSSSWSGSEMEPEKNLPFLPSTDLTIPQVIRSSFISSIEKNKNPITIQLRDGTQIHVTMDQFNRINKKPEVGKRITVIFQRSNDDLSDTPSKIEKIECD
jgi:hypothetical protein